MELSDVTLVHATTAIITRTKDRNLLVPRAVESVLNQTCDDWVHVIVNDGGSRPALDAVLAPYRERYRGRLVIVHNPKTVGMEASSNIGIEAVSSRFALIHDDDDSLKPEFLAQCVPLLDEPPVPSVRAVASLTLLIEETIDGEVVAERASRLFKTLGPLLTLGSVADSNPCPPISLLFRRDAWEEVGRFDERLPVLGDWDFLLRLVERYDIYVVQEALANYHVRPSIAGGGYANTVTAGLDRHRLYDAFLRNRYARTGGNTTISVLMQAYGEPGAGGGPLRELRELRGFGAKLAMVEAEVGLIRRRMPISILRMLFRKLTRHSADT